jgi:hypothetical protein
MPGLYSQYIAKIRVVLCSTFLLDQVYVMPRLFHFTSGMHKFIYLFIHIFKVTDCKSIHPVACIRLDVLLNLQSSSKEFAQSAQHTIIYSRQIQSLTDCNTVQLHQSDLLLHSVNLYILYLQHRVFTSIAQM